MRPSENLTRANPSSSNWSMYSVMAAPIFSQLKIFCAEGAISSTSSSFSNFEAPSRSIFSTDGWNLLVLSFRSVSVRILSSKLCWWRSFVRSFASVCLAVSAVCRAMLVASCANMAALFSWGSAKTSGNPAGGIKGGGRSSGMMFSGKIDERWRAE